MEIKAGAYYKTRDGRKAFVTGINPFDGPSSKTYRVLGAVEGYGITGWFDGGTYGAPDSVPDGLDLVAEWKEPRKASSTFCLITCCGEPFMAIDGLYPEDRVIARKTITITEGEGL